MRALQSTAKKQICVNGTRYESMTAAALACDMPLWKMQRVVSGKIKIEGIKVSDIKKKKTAKPEIKKPSGEKHEVLIRYPLYEKPIDRGANRVWY